MDTASSGQVDAKSAFADAVARAREIAAKINQPAPGGGDAPVLKRPLSNDGQAFGEPEQKKTIAAINDPIGAQLKALQTQNSSAAQAAQEAAARINQQLGIRPASQPPNTIPQSLPTMQKAGVPPHTGLGMVVTEDFQVPDHMVGLIIGKGGEQITRLQAETSCKIQIAPDSGGAPERPCTLTGSPASIASCKQQMQDIIRKGQQAGGGTGGPDIMGGGNENTVIEMMIPGDKVGLVIGKGGENIKQLQESCGVKMVMIQDSNIPSSSDKPLRISGDPLKCQRAREMVMNQLKDKDFDGNFKMGGGGNNYGNQSSIEIPVPRNLVGIVIGKNGDVIKNIQKDTLAKVQFKPEEPGMFHQGQEENPFRYCSIKGTQEQVEQAAERIEQLLGESAHRSGNDGSFGGMNMGPGRGMGRGDNRNFNEEQTTFSVPADKCGLVIGKGGDTIRQINSMSCAKVELQRTPGPNPNEKIFNIRAADRNQIQHAIQLICERAGLPCPPPGGPGGPGGQGPHGGPGGPQGGPGGYGDGGGYGGQPGQQPPNNQYGGPQGPQAAWGNYNQPQNYQQQQQQPDPSKQQQDNAAAWAAYYQYYSNYGQQQGQPQQQGQAPQQPPQQQQQGQAQPQQTSFSAANHSSINPSTGQPDYSAAWAEYYRSQGMHLQANMILQQAAAAASGQSGGQMAPSSVQQPQ